MSRKTKVIEILHRYNKNDHSNVCVRHFGERVLRNVRWITVYGIQEQIAECTIKGEDVHVAIHPYGAAHILNHQAWEFVYGPADEKGSASC